MIDDREDSRFSADKLPSLRTEIARKNDGLQRPAGFVSEKHRIFANSHARGLVQPKLHIAAQQLARVPSLVAKHVNFALVTTCRLDFHQPNYTATTK